MAKTLIFTGLLEIISNSHAGNAEKLGKPPLPNVPGFFMNMKATRLLDTASGTLAC
jgi:hypothetical protein